MAAEVDPHQLARELAETGNAAWAEKRGPLRDVDGFQVVPLVSKKDGEQAFYVSIYGGRSMWGTQREVLDAMFQYLTRGGER